MLGLVILFNGLLALLFSLFYIIREFDRFLHRGWAKTLLHKLNNTYTTITFPLCLRECIADVMCIPLASQHK